MNQTILVGRLTTTPTIDYTEINNKYTKFTLAITRNYKNIDGEYETDFIPVLVFNQMAENVTEYTRRGDLIGVKGRLETRDNELVVIADRITFLSSSQIQNNVTTDIINNNNTNNLGEGEI